MDTTRLSSKGQVILPKAVREARNWQPGTEFTVEEVDDGVLLRPIKPFKPTTLDEVVGCTGYKGPAKSVEDMEHAIARGVKERRARGRY
ncbi:MAG: AbrB/MazE/SpoVT family DNA-binding domain-containing protein [Bacteroidota bacterium]